MDNEKKYKITSVILYDKDTNKKVFEINPAKVNFEPTEEYIIDLKGKI